MDTVSSWIRANTVKTDGGIQKTGFRIKHAVPPVFEAYALIYHPYRIPAGEIVFEWEQEIRAKRQRAERVTRMLKEEYGVAVGDWLLVALESERYNLEELIAQKLRAYGYTGSQIDKPLKAVRDGLLRAILQPLQNLVDASLEDSETADAEVDNRETQPKREISWKAIYQIYGLPFSDQANWSTLSRGVKPENRIWGEEMPEMDRMPQSVRSAIARFLKSRGIDQTAVGSRAAQATRSLAVEELPTVEDLYLIASPSRDWLFITPHDFCRTIIAGKRAFVADFLKSGYAEVSGLLGAEHRLDERS
ncbi:MAG: hypothetical protein GVY26_11695 [Bacteroidetes bacterium]|nr:hypothetical protein [Bacteroidota bacterium]